MPVKPKSVSQKKSKTKSAPITRKKKFDKAAKIAGILMGITGAGLLAKGGYDMYQQNKERKILLDRAEKYKQAYKSMDESRKALWVGMFHDDIIRRIGTMSEKEFETIIVQMGKNKIKNNKL